MCIRDRSKSGLESTQEGSGSLDDLASLQTSSAHLKSSGSPIDDRTHRLKIWLKSPLGSIVRMRNSIAKLSALTTDFTALSHNDLHNECNLRAGQLRICAQHETKISVSYTH